MVVLVVWVVPGERVVLVVRVLMGATRQCPEVWGIPVAMVVMELPVVLVVLAVVRERVECWCSSVITGAVVWVGPAVMVGGPVRRVMVATARPVTAILVLAVRGVLVGMRVPLVLVVLVELRVAGVRVAGRGRSG